MATKYTCPNLNCPVAFIVMTVHPAKCPACGGPLHTACPTEPEDDLIRQWYCGACNRDIMARPHRPGCKFEGGGPGHSRDHDSPEPTDCANCGQLTANDKYCGACLAEADDAQARHKSDRGCKVRPAPQLSGTKLKRAQFMKLWLPLPTELGRSLQADGMPGRIKANATVITHPGHDAGVLIEWGWNDDDEHENSTH